MAKSYYEKLKDPRWLKKRVEILTRDEFTCVECGAADKPLHVHHGCYVPKFDPWSYPNATLHTVCEDCHVAVQNALAYVHLQTGCFTGDELRMLYPLLRQIFRMARGNQNEAAKASLEIVAGLSAMAGRYFENCVRRGNELEREESVR